MSRANYNEDCDGNWGWIQWRGAVTSAIRGVRGQAFLEEMLHALAALPERKLIGDHFECDGAVCAIGAVGKARGIDMADMDPDDSDGVAAKFGISQALAREIVYVNDEAGRLGESPEDRFERMRRWIENSLNWSRPLGEAEQPVSQTK